MAGRTVSAYVPDDLAESVALEARREERSPGQIAALALRFFMALPRDARASMIVLDNLGTPDERRQAMNEVARTLNAAEFEMTCRRIADRALALVPNDAPEDERDAAAASLTKSALQRCG
jgi:hypothetical protein